MSKRILVSFMILVVVSAVTGCQLYANSGGRVVDGGGGDVSVVVVAGKGGVGKTTVTAVIARAASDAGQRVLVVELDGKPALAELVPGIDVVAITCITRHNLPELERLHEPGAPIR